MTETLETRFRIASWDEQPYREFDDGSKLTRAEVALEGVGDGPESASFNALMHYRPDGTSTYVTLMRITGTLGSRTGSFVLRGHGTYDGTTARVESEIVADSGAEGLRGIRGAGESASTHADYPHMPFTLRYDLA